MTMNETPFGPPAVLAVPQLAGFRARQVAEPDVLCERLRRAGGHGVGMLAERGPDGRTVVAARCLLRLELRGEEVVVRALEAAARPLLPLLAARVDGATVADDVLRAPASDRPAAPGIADDEVLAAPSCLDVLRAAAGLLGDARPGAPLPPGLLGAFGYELVDRWEAIGARRPDPLDEPDFSFVLVADAVVYAGETVTAVVRGLPWERAGDVEARRRTLAALLERAPRRGSAPSPAPVARPAAAPQPASPEFVAGVHTLLDHIAAGDVFQAVLSRAVALPSPASPGAVLRALGDDAPWRFRLDLGDGELVGASPETCLCVAGGEVELRPLAGTLPRGLGPDGGIDDDLDRRLGVQLLLDDKEQAEHAMLVDLARNDVARVAVPGSTRLAEAFALLRLPRVQHIASRVVGRLRPGLDALHAYRAVANMGTLTGAPKPRAMELVRGLEPTARGFYGGAVAFLGADGDLRSCIAIRALRHRRGEAVYHARAGAGVVHGSRPERELAETEHKLLQLRQAVATAATEVPA